VVAWIARRHPSGDYAAAPLAWFDQLTLLACAPSCVASADRASPRRRHSALHTVFTSSASRPQVMLATLGYRQHLQAALQ